MFRQNNGDKLSMTFSTPLRVDSYWLSLLGSQVTPYFTFQIRLRFALIEGPEFLRLSDLSRDFIISTDLQVQGDPQHFVYDKFDKKPAGTYYWFLGEEFRGDMVSFRVTSTHCAFVNLFA